MKAPSVADSGTVFLVPAAWVVAATIFFRGSVLTGFSRVTGDDGDTKLIIYLHEHWVQVLRGLVPWNGTPFFYPATDTLGFSDTFVLDELFYAPLRWIGLDEFLAYQWTLLMLSLVGCLTAYYLLRKILRTAMVCAALAITFTFSNILYVQAGHTQLYAIYWIPLILLLLLRIQAAPRSASGSAFLAGLTIGLLFLSTFYVAWFFVLCSIVWLLTWAVLQRLTSACVDVHPVRATTLRYRRSMIGMALGALVGGVPFLLVYLPHFGSSRSFGVAVGYGAEPADVINTGARNYWWGPLTRQIFGRSRRLGNGELAFGLTPVLLVALLAATIYLCWRFNKHAPDRQAMGPALATAVTCWSTIVLPMKILGLSPWYVVWLIVPGARAIRAIDRIGVFASLLAPVVIAFVVADILKRASTAVIRQRLLIGSVVLTLLTSIEQANSGHNAGLDRAGQLAALEAVPAPPSGCRVFYLTATRDGSFAYVSSIEAMMIAQTLTWKGRPMATINGFSGQFPSGFGDAADPGARSYDSAIRSWVADHGIVDGLCGYDLAGRRWTVGPVS